MAIRKFTRSSTNKMLAGVCGGIADYLKVDVTIVRLIVAGASIISAGVVPVLYVVAWLVLPDDRTGEIGLDAVADFYAAHRNRPAPQE